MDKENLAFKRLFTSLTREALEAIHSEAQQQTLCALLLTLVGLFLTFAGLITLVIKLRRIASCRFLLMTQRLENKWHEGKLSDSGQMQEPLAQDHCQTPRRDTTPTPFALGTHHITPFAQPRIKVPQ